MNNKLERMWNETSVASFKALSKDLAEGPVETCKISVRASGLRTKIWIWKLISAKQKFQLLHHNICYLFLSLRNSMLSYAWFMSPYIK